MEERVGVAQRSEQYPASRYAVYGTYGFRVDKNRTVAALFLYAMFQ
jgi:hypothetical protein